MLTSECERRLKQMFLYSCLIKNYKNSLIVVRCHQKVIAALYN